MVSWLKQPDAHPRIRNSRIVVCPVGWSSSAAVEKEVGARGVPPSCKVCVMAMGPPHGTQVPRHLHLVAGEGQRAHQQAGKLADWQLGALPAEEELPLPLQEHRGQRRGHCGGSWQEVVSVIATQHEQRYGCLCCHPCALGQCGQELQSCTDWSKPTSSAVQIPRTGTEGSPHGLRDTSKVLKGGSPPVSQGHLQ